MNKLKFLTNPLVSLLLFVFSIGCSSITSSIKFSDTYVPSAGAKVDVVPVKNDIQETFELDINKTFFDALTEELKKKELLIEGNVNASSRLTISSKILEYIPGNAFKRWLLPGWGATKLTVACRLLDSNNAEIGTITTYGDISGGGLYSVGAWKSIFNDVAKDVVSEIYKKHNNK